MSTRISSSSRFEITVQIEHKSFNMQGRSNVALSATLSQMGASYTTTVRAFKTSWFAKAAGKAHITDDELCSAMAQVAVGQADDLGGGVYKKRLKKNQYRSIILAKAGTFWIYEYLFAKQDRANIDDDELIEFRKLVKVYGTLMPKQVDRLLQDQDWMEICNGNQA